jgi:hypothetical protein
MYMMSIVSVMRDHSTSTRDHSEFSSSREQEMGSQAAKSTPNAVMNMKRAYERAVAEHGPLDWMTWTLGYCRQCFLGGGAR